MHRIPALALMLVAFAARAEVPAGPLPRESAALPRTLRATGEARVSVRPDVALVTVGVEVEGKDLQKAARDAAAQTREVLAALRREGIADKDIQTARHDIEAERPWENNRPGPITGYAVVNELRVTVREVGRLDAVLGRVVAAGSNVLRGVSFQKEDVTNEKARALSLAIANARTKAEAMAKAAGVQLGEVVAVSEGAGSWPVLPMSMARASAAVATISSGEVDVTVSAEVVFDIVKSAR